MCGPLPRRFSVKQAGRSVSTWAATRLSSLRSHGRLSVDRCREVAWPARAICTRACRWMEAGPARPHVNRSGPQRHASNCSTGLPARDGLAGHQLAEVVRIHARVEQPVAHERDQVVESPADSSGRQCRAQRIEQSWQHGGPRRRARSVGSSGTHRIVAARAAETFRWRRIASSSRVKAPLWKKPGATARFRSGAVRNLYRSAGLPVNLLEAEVLVLSGAVENDVARSDAEDGRDLRHADDVLREVAEHLVRRGRATRGS